MNKSNKSITSNKSIKSNNSIKTISMEKRIEDLKDNIKSNGNNKNHLFSRSGRMELDSSPFNIMASDSSSIIKSPCSILRSQSKDFVINNNEFMTMCQTPMSPRKSVNEIVDNTAHTRLIQLKTEQERLEKLIKLKRDKLQQGQQEQQIQQTQEQQIQQVQQPQQTDNSNTKNLENLTNILGKLGL